MKRILTLTFAMTFILVCVAGATETRVMSMGGVNNIVRDDANITLYPQTVALYDGLFTIESDNEDFYNMGANWAMGDDVLGVYFSQEDYETYFSNSDGDYWMDNRIGLVYGRQMGENPFGIALNYYCNSFKNEDADADDNYEQKMGRIEFLAGATLMDGALDLAAGFGMNMWTDEGAWGPGETGEYTAQDGSSSFGVYGRYWMEPGEKWQYVPHAGFMMHKEGVEYFEAVDDSDYLNEVKYTSFDLGFGTNYNVSPDVMTVTDFGFMLMNQTRNFTDSDDADNNNEWEDKYMTLPYFKIGLDAKVREWLDFRCGVNNYWETNNYVDDMGTVDTADDRDRTWKDAYTDMYLGFGMHWGNFIIDGMMDDSELLHNGPYFLTGASSDEMAGRLSITYLFD